MPSTNGNWLACVEKQPEMKGSELGRQKGDKKGQKRGVGEDWKMQLVIAKEGCQTLFLERELMLLRTPYLKCSIGKSDRQYYWCWRCWSSPNTRNGTAWA